MLSTSPLATGSETLTNTMGIVFEVRSSAWVIGEPAVKMTVGAEPTTLAAIAGPEPDVAPPHR